MCVVVLFLSFTGALAQQEPVNAERTVPLSQPAVASDAEGIATLEATLRTTALSGAPDTPVTNIRIVVRNISSVFFDYVSGVVTFYDGSGVRCGEGLFKADVLAPNESVEMDTPGIRITCSPGGWRIVTTDLVPRAPIIISTPAASSSNNRGNLSISIDGQEHPIQIDRPLVVTLGDAKRTIVVRRSQ
jgi:hypothetical protein